VGYGRTQRVNEHSAISVRKVSVMRSSVKRVSISNEPIASHPPVSPVQHPFGSIRPKSPLLVLIGSMCRKERPVIDAPSALTPRTGLELFMLMENTDGWRSRVWILARLKPSTNKLFSSSLGSIILAGATQTSGLTGACNYQHLHVPRR
jgi:hypothetical protein